MITIKEKRMHKHGKCCRTQTKCYPVVLHCDTESERDEVVEEMQKYLTDK
jgi:hypothetical protein